MNGALHIPGFSGVVGEQGPHTKRGRMRQNSKEPALRHLAPVHIISSDLFQQKDITHYVKLVLLFECYCFNTFACI